MDSLRDRLQTWFTTPFSGEAPGRRAAPRPPPPQDEPVYVLRSWPDLPPDLKTARVYRALSIMSVGDCSRLRLLAHTNLREEDLDRLLERLVRAGWVEIRLKGCSALPQGP